MVNDCGTEIRVVFQDMDIFGEVHRRLHFLFDWFAQLVSQKAITKGITGKAGIRRSPRTAGAINRSNIGHRSVSPHTRYGMPDRIP